MEVGPTELIIILLIVILLFGVGRIGKLGKDLGSGIRAFREGLQGEGEAPIEEVKNTVAAPVVTPEAAPLEIVDEPSKLDTHPE